MNGQDYCVTPHAQLNTLWANTMVYSCGSHASSLHTGMPNKQFQEERGLASAPLPTHSTLSACKVKLAWTDICHSGGIPTHSKDICHSTGIPTHSKSGDIILPSLSPPVSYFLYMRSAGVYIYCNSFLY